MMMMIRTIRFAAVTLIALVCNVATIMAQDEAMTTRVPLDSNVRIGKLENGLTYYLRHNEKPEHRVDFYIAQKVGSILEEPQQRGLAHFLEHMAFNGSKNFPGNENGKSIVDWCESKAIKFGTNLNAYTGVDETVYQIMNVPTDNASVLDSCLLILHDWSNSILLTDEEIDKERGVIREEWRSSDSGLMRIYKAALPTLYPDSKYSDCLPIGDINVINNFPYKDLRDYYKTWYRPDLQGIIIVGDIDIGAMEAKIKASFADIPMAVGKPERIYYPVSDNKEPIIYVGSDKELSIPNVQIFYKHDATPDEEKSDLKYLMESYALTMIADMLNSRFSIMEMTATPPFNAAYSEYGNYLLAKTKDAFCVTVECSGDGIAKALDAALTETARVKRHGFTAAEYERAKANYLQALESAYNERKNTKNDSYVNEYVEHFLNGIPTPGIEYEYQVMGQIAESIDIETINRFATGELLPDSNTVLFIAVPEASKEQCPDVEAVRNMLNDINNRDIEPYVDTASNEPLLDNVPDTGKIVAESQDGIYGSTKLILGNGVTVYVKTTDFKEDEINVLGVSPGGTYMFDDKDKLEIEYLGELGLIGGLGKFSKTDLNQLLSGKKATVSASFSTLRESVSGTSSPKDLETLLQLTYLTFTSPRKDADAFASFKTRLKASLENTKANPLSSFSDSAQIALYGKTPRTVIMQPEDVDKLNYDRALEMYIDRLSDASDFTFFFVGNINIEDAKPLIEKYLGSLPAKGRIDKPSDRNIDIIPGTRTKEYAKQQETPMATTTMVYSGKATYSLRSSILMSILSQAFDMVFTDEIREKEGGTYGVSCYGSVVKLPKEIEVLQIVYQTDPAKKDGLNKKIDTLVADMAANGPTEEQLQKIKSYMTKRHSDNIKENSYWLGVMNELTYTGNDFTAQYSETLNSITVDDVKEFASSLINQGNKVTVILTVPEN